MKRLKSIVRGIFCFGPTRCPACGRHARLRVRKAMWPELGRQWGLTPEQYGWFDQREGTVCANCGNSLRARQLASVIVDRLNRKLGTAHFSLREMSEEPRAADLKVAEINGTGGLHPFLSELRGLHYSEYGSRSAEVPSEDLSALSYDDSAFDLVLTSDTLEHVADFPRALGEIRRVLKPGGLHIFTIPVIWDRETRQRASVVEGKLVHHLPPSHHGDPTKSAADFLVFHEFGGDVNAAVRAAGFELSVVQDERNPALTTFVARKMSAQGPDA